MTILSLSGERPFRCKICDMSFTTNGNMHRHSRIHQKNGINIKPPGRKSAAESKATPEKIPSSSLPSSSPSPSMTSGSQAHLSSLMAGYLEPGRASPRNTQQDQNAEFMQYLSKYLIILHMSPKLSIVVEIFVTSRSKY